MPLNIPEKQTGDQLAASEFNEVVDYINTLDTELDNAEAAIQGKQDANSALDDVSGVNTGDETTSTIQTKRPLKTINGNSLEGTGDITTPVTTDASDLTSGTLPDARLSSAVQSSLDEIDNKQDTLVSGTNIKTINNESILGSGNITISGGGGSTSWGNISGNISNQTDLQAELDSKLESVDKNDVGLGNVDNTSDLDKPISTATQTALDSKLESVVAGSNVTIDNTDPLNPVISATGGGSGGDFIESDITGLTNATKIENIVAVDSESDIPDPQATGTFYIVENPPQLPSVPVSSTGTEIDLGSTGGNYMNMSSPNSATTYTYANETLGGWSKILINSATEPTITSATKIVGADFFPSTNMYMVVEYNGNIVEYFFLEI